MHHEAGGGAAPLDDMITDSRPGAAPAPAGAPSPADDLDAWIDRDVRLRIEARYLAPITALGRFEEILRDEGFLADPVGHPALFADHGVTHARDVAHQVLQVLDTVTGRLIPARTPDRLQWMKAYGVLLAFVHDIGMIDPSPEGRAVHPEAAAREVMGPGFDAILDALRAADPAGLARRVFATFADDTSARAALARDDRDGALPLEAKGAGRSPQRPAAPSGAHARRGRAAWILRLAHRIRPRDARAR